MEALATVVSRSSFPASIMQVGSSHLTGDDMDTLFAVRDLGVRLGCEVDPAPGLLLRFQQYERGVSEILGGPYTGRGRRREIALAAVDDRGRYIIRFGRTSDPHQSAEDRARPDVIVQVLGVDRRATFESAPYARVANLQRIDLCVPRGGASERAAAALRIRRHATGGGVPLRTCFGSCLAALAPIRGAAPRSRGSRLCEP